VQAASERIKPIEPTNPGVVVPGPQVLHGDSLIELFAAVEEGG